MNFKLAPKIKSEDRAKLNKYSDILANLLYHRGLKTNEAAGAFIDLDYENGLNDPLKLKDIEIAVERILRAISEKEKICIYSDYDADGIPGAVVLSDFFKKIKFDNYFVYFPHRNREGFGLNKGAVEKIADLKTRLVITVDCGVSDVAPIALAAERGLDVIVTDHHDPNNHQTKALAIVNPKQKSCLYADKNLCGTGVIFKVVQALIQKGHFDIGDGWEKWLLDLVGVATLSDMVPLIGENRVLAKYGLMVMKKSPRRGFIRLLKECKIDQNKITEDDVGFSVAPRINAASRMDEPEIAYKMLSATDDVSAEETVKHLHKINAERKSAVATIVKKIKKELGDNFTRPILVKGSPDWQPSLLGLVANSLVETYKRPVFLWGRGSGENLKGSCRSDGTVNLVEMMNAVSPGIIGEFGGHKMAGGFIVYDDGVYNLPTELEKAYEKVQDGASSDEILVDGELRLEDVNWNLYNDLQKLAPFGVQNEKPKFLFRGVVLDKVDFFGKDKNHLRLHLRGGRGRSVSAIKFFGSDSETFSRMAPGKTIDLIASLEKSDFGRRSELRLKIIEAGAI
ncbi:MAG TPA: single-stranded-DNA-specific exonuclease RecJ [Candidatus Paceibacterota bacterium]|nr:single-stranded-DNA-specific exonuclease RecJ [Candidatus Paceibacterota bacterium]HRZ34272.1 single-stranded-DNA-specific exonuclease RecJ [Candidatus Paceibacterota bacterium]